MDKILPPRKGILTQTKICKTPSTPLQILQLMGFSKQRAEKSLAATGDKDPHAAVDWLLSHVNDPLLDENVPREYIVYACPTGELLDQLKVFFERSLVEIGWNRAHNYAPHITLVSFFKAPDDCSQLLGRVLEQVVKRELANCKSSVNFLLEKHFAPTYVGLLVDEEKATILKNIALQYVKEVSNNVINDNYEQLDAIATCFPWCTTATGRFSMLPGNMQYISLEPHVKSLHLSLAYEFDEKQLGDLRHTVTTTLDTDQDTQWDIRLYSRDAGMAGKAVLKVIASHAPKETDELELKIGDFIYVSEEDIVNCKSGWVEGTSWFTGLTGVFPLVYTERTPETDVWTLHRSVPLYEEKSLIEKCNEIASRKMETDEKMVADDVEGDSGAAFKRDLFLMRHGERVDLTMGNWIAACFSKDGIYERLDLNQPVTIPKRKGVPGVLELDGPLTNVGLLQARLTGEALILAKAKVSYAFCSPAYRCLQTCAGVLKGMGIADKLPICVEPMLFEWLGWYTSRDVPDWMTYDELTAAGLYINRNYKPLANAEAMRKIFHESIDQYYDRSYEVMKHILSIAEDGGNILVVGHASTPEVCSRQLIGLEPRNKQEFDKLLYMVPYCSLMRVHDNGKSWSIQQPPIPSMTQSHIKPFKWKEFL